MKLSELFYQVVRNVVLYESNSQLTRLALREYAYTLTSGEGGLTFSDDYKTTIDNAFLAINQGIQRIAMLDKLKPLRTELEVSNNEVDISLIQDKINRIISVYIEKPKQRTYEVIEYREATIEGVAKLILEPMRNLTKVIVEYYPEIPTFSFEDISYHEDELEEEEADNDVELRDYGLTNQCVSSLLVFTKGILGRDVYGVEADRWINQAEAYINDLNDFGGDTLHLQNEVELRYTINGESFEF